MKATKNILVVDLGGIGDLILSIPFLRGIKKSFPDCSVSVLCAKRAGDLLLSQPYIDKIYPTDMSPMNLLHTSFQMRKNRFDLAVNLMPETSLYAATKMCILFFLINAREWAGRNTEGRGFFYTIKILENKMQEENEVVLYGRLLRAIGGNNYDETLEFRIPQGLKLEAKKLLKNEAKNEHIPLSKPLIAVNPGSDWTSKRWPIERYGELLQRLHLKYPLAQFIILGTQKEINLASYLKNSVGKNIYILSGKTNLSMLPALLQHTDLLITNDSGPSHIARAIGIPVVTLVGPGLPGYAKVRGRSESIVLQHPVACYPCLKRVCDDLRCWKSISVDEVFEKVTMLLQRRAFVFE